MTQGSKSIMSSAVADRNRGGGRRVRGLSPLALSL